MSAADERVLTWTEGAIWNSAASREDKSRDLEVLAWHNWIPYRPDEEGPRCLTCGVPFPCDALRAVAENYGWTEGER